MMIKPRKCTKVAFLTAGALLALLSFSFSHGQTPVLENTLEIREIAGVTSHRYPIQIGRPFLKGEIPDQPQVLLNGQPVSSQADVKTRWPDGSVKHAVLTFVIPTLQAGSTVKVSFANAPGGGSDHGLSTQDMLSPDFDFDAQMVLADAAGKWITVSAREMLRTGHYERWLNGPITTSIILADHSPDACFDMGFGPFKSFRPIVHATFWPQISKIRVRFIGEVANTEFLQDMHYSLALLTGDRKKVQVYEKPLFTHHAASRWTKEFWIGGSPSPVEIDPNPAYLAATGFIPNYDLTKTISEGAMEKAYGQWLASPRDLFDSGLWVRAMGTAGGRSEIGPYPRPGRSGGFTRAMRECARSLSVKPTWRQPGRCT